MSEVHVDGGLITAQPADYHGFVYCADCQWHSEHRMNYEQLVKALGRRLADHRQTTHNNGSDNG